MKPPTVENYHDLADGLPEYWHKLLNQALADAYHRGHSEALDKVAANEPPF